MTGRRSRISFAVLVAAMVLIAGGYVAWAAVRSDNTAQSGAGSSVLRSVTSGAYAVFLTSKSGVAPFDQLAIAPLAHPDRHYLVGMRCDRVAMTGHFGACVRHDVGIGVDFHVTFFNGSFTPLGTGHGGGIPSRARVSPSGHLGTVTSFVQGDSYLIAGQFSTTATIFRTDTGKTVVDNLEHLRVLRNGRRFEPLNRNFWGVTFIDDQHFYATMGTGSKTYLVHGDLATRTLTTVHENVECPSLSPDGTRIGFKRRIKNGEWRFTVLNLRTGAEQQLSEQRSIDDQLAWLDSDDLVYGLDGTVWKVRADGRGAPVVLLHNADSPTIVRPATNGV